MLHDKKEVLLERVEPLKSVAPSARQVVVRSVNGGSEKAVLLMDADALRQILVPIVTKLVTFLDTVLILIALTAGYRFQLQSDATCTHKMCTAVALHTHRTHLPSVGDMRMIDQE